MANKAEQPYDVVVVGAGQAGIPLAHRLARAGQRVALVERRRLGGSCVNFGCTPTKAAIASARVAQLARRAWEFGLEVPEVRVDFPRVLARARAMADQSRIALRKGLEETDNPRLLRGHARFTGQRGGLFRLRIDQEDGEAMEVAAPRVVLDTGTRSLVPRVPGLERLDYLEAGNWLERSELPEHLAVIGGSFTGLEMAQFYRRMGSRVTVIERGPLVAGHEDDDVARALRQFLEAEGIDFVMRTRLVRVRRVEEGLRLTLARARRTSFFDASHLFVAAGRRPNTGDLGLDKVGVERDRRGFVRTDRHLATNVRGIWAAGDMRGGPMFTHTAWDDHRVLLGELGAGPRRTAERIPAHALFTDPQLGRVGMTEREARRGGRRVRVATFEMSRNGKAREIGEPGGLVKVVADARSRRLLGAAVVAAEGAELVHVFLALMSAKAPYTVLRDAVLIHPTLAEALQSAVAELAEPE